MSEDNSINEIRELLFGASTRSVQEKIDAYEQQLSELKQTLASEGSQQFEQLKSKLDILNGELENRYKTLDNSFHSIIESKDAQINDSITKIKDQIKCSAETIEGFNNHISALELGLKQLELATSDQLRIQSSYIDESLGAMRDIYENQINLLNDHVTRQTSKEAVLQVLREILTTR